MAALETCPTKWWFRYVAGLPGETAPQLDFGIAAHARLENYLRTGGAGELQQTEQAMLPYLPKPDPQLAVEQPLHGGQAVLLGGIPLVGWADCIDLTPPAARVSDWKFKADIGKWATKPAVLTDAREADGRQLIAAAKWVFQNHPEIDTVTPRHVTSQTGGIDSAGHPKGPFGAKESIGTSLNRVDVDRRWDFIVGQFELRLRETAAKAVAADALGNTKACFKYGRPCIYLDICPHKKSKEKTVNFPPPKIAQSVQTVAQAATQTAPIILYFGGSFPMRQAAATLHDFATRVEIATLQQVLGGKYDPTEHHNIIAIEHPRFNFSKWKAELGTTALAMLPELPGGHYLVTDEERVRVVANAILPAVHAVGGPRF
jgi:hypothetical protein